LWHADGVHTKGPVALLRRLPSEAAAAAALVRAVGFKPTPPHRIARMAAAAARLRLGAAPTLAALRYGEAPALVDERGSLSFADLDRRSNALADRWCAQGLEQGVTIGIMCRNHRGFLDALAAGGKLGARMLLLNTEFAGPQVAEVCAREGVDLLVHDAELAEAVGEVGVRFDRVVAWSDGDAGGLPTLDELIAAGNPERSRWLTRSGSVVLLTSGTTGTPKGATRGRPTSLATAGGLFGQIPLRGGESTYVAPPLFHAWGLSNAMAAMALGSTIVTGRRFDAETALRLAAQQRCTAVVVVPVMLKRIVALDPAVVAALDLSALRIVASSGSQLEGALAAEVMDRLGDVLYNFYGSTEVAAVAVGTPDDLRAAPGCAGRPPRGVTVRILDAAGNPQAPGATGRIFVANGAEFAGYTDGGNKQVIDGLMSSGDVGHFDAAGRLFVDGRDDEMIVSGGENVFPREVEELLAGHPAVADVAAIGVADDDFGQRLRVFVVRREGADLGADEVRTYVRGHLARYKVPREVVFMEGLPRNPAGKILKRVLAELEVER